MKTFSSATTKPVTKPVGDPVKWEVWIWIGENGARFHAAGTFDTQQEAHEFIRKQREQHAYEQKRKI